MTIVAEAFVRIRPDDKDFPKQVETSARQAATKGGDVARKTFLEKFRAAGKESHSAFLSAFDHFGSEFKHRFLQGIQFGVGAFTGIRAFQGLESVFAEGFQSEKLFQTSTAQLNAVLKSTHGVAGESADSVNRLAERIAAYSGETVNALRNSQVMLLGFTNVRDVAGKNNDVFQQAAVLSEDLAKRYGGDVSNSARMLGRALNDPARGLLLLRRAGVQLTAQQADQAKKLAASGHVLEAQKVILDAVRQKVGGAADAYGKTLPGQVARAREQFNEFSRIAVEALIPSITRAGTALLTFARNHAAQVTAAFKTLGDWIGKVVTVLGVVASFISKHAELFQALAVGALATAAAIKAIAVAQALWNAVAAGNPILAVVKVVIALAAALIYAWKTSKTFRDTVTSVFQAIERVIGAVVSTVIRLFKDMLDVWLTVVGTMLNAIDKVAKYLPFGIGNGINNATKAFNAFRTSVDGTLGGLATDAGNWGSSAGDAFATNFLNSARFQVALKTQETSRGAVAELAAQHRTGPKGPALKVSPTVGTNSPGYTSATAPTHVSAVSPDFTPIPKAAAAAATAKNKAAATAKEIVAKAVPVGLTAAAVIKAIGDAVAKGRPGVLAELTKLASQIRVTLNAPAAHGARDQIIEVLNKRRAALGKLADQYVTITKKIDDATQKLTDAQQAQADFFSSLKDTFTSAGALVNVLSGLSDQVNPGGAAVGGFLQAQVNSLNAFLDNLDKLKQEGLSPDLIKQLATAGPDQGGRIAAGLTGASQAQIQRINDLEAQLQSRAASGAQQLTNDFYQAGIDQLKTELANDRKELAKISAALNNLEKRIGDDVGRGVAAGLHATAATANAKARAKTRQASAGHKAR